MTFKADKLKNENYLFIFPSNFFYLFHYNNSFPIISTTHLASCESIIFFTDCSSRYKVIATDIQLSAHSLPIHRAKYMTITRTLIAKISNTNL